MATINGSNTEAASISRNGVNPEQLLNRSHSLSEQMERDPGLPVANSTKPHWQQPPHAIYQRQTLEMPAETDVVVIGSGITGCSVAKQLLEQDKDIRVTVLEARNITSGATGRNGGHIKAVPEVSYSELVPHIGKSRAQEVVHFTLKNVQELFRVAKGLPEDLKEYSEVRPVESLNLFTDEASFEHMKTAVERFDEDIPNLKGRGRIVEKAELAEKYGVMNAVGGMVSAAGAAWPYRLITSIHGLLLDQFGDRFTIEANTPVETIDYDAAPDRYTIHTSRGPIRCRIVVHATNGHAGHLLPGIRGALFPVRGQMTAQTPSKAFGVHGQKQSWSIHYGKGFDYITQSARSGEIFVGGALINSDPSAEISNPRDDANCVRSVAHLGGIMDATFGRPVRDEIKSTWTGVMGFTTDSLPLVGRLSKAGTLRHGSNEFVSAGYNGYGMPNAWLCGKHVADLVLGRKEVQMIPSAYFITEERLKGMDAAASAQHWMSVFEKL